MRLIGIDFSAAADAGRAIWLAEGEDLDGRLQVLSLRPAAELSGGGRARDAALAALRSHVAGLGPAIVGIDAPNSLPRAVVPDAWETWLTSFAAVHPTPEDFRAACRLASGGRELRRPADVVAKTPFAPWNLRLYRQTWHSVAGLYAPLVAAQAVTVAPFQRPRAGRPRLAEICPASTLKHLGLYRPYKGHGEAPRAQRKVILAALRRRTPLDLPKSLAARALENAGGDALDALVALTAAARCQRAGLFDAHDPGHEGEVYVWA